LSGVALAGTAARRFLLVALCLLVVFVGTRYWTGCDYEGYLLRFRYEYVNAEFYEMFVRREPGFHLLNWLIYYFEFDYVWLNVFSAAIFFAGFTWFARLSPCPLLMLALFFPVMIVQLSMSGLRQSLAVAFLMLAIVQVVRGRPLLSALMIVLGAQFHQSAYGLLPLSMLAWPTIRPIWGILAAAVAAPLGLYLMADAIEIFSDRYVEQIYGENNAQGAYLRYVLLALPLPFFFQFRKNIARQFPDLYRLLLTFAIGTLAVLPVGLVSSVILHRLIYYALPISILMCTVLAAVLTQGNKAPSSFRASAQRLPNRQHPMADRAVTPASWLSSTFEGPAYAIGPGRIKGLAHRRSTGRNERRARLAAFVMPTVDPKLALVPALAYGAYIIGWFSFSRHAQLCYVPYQTVLLQ
jgi:hypothetical protein